MLSSRRDQAVEREALPGAFRRSWRGRRLAPGLEEGIDLVLLEAEALADAVPGKLSVPDQAIDGVARNAEQASELIDGKQRRPRLGIRCRSVSAHGVTVAPSEGQQVNADEKPADVLAAWHRLDRFRREWLGKEEPKLSGGTWFGALNIDDSGLLEAAETVAEHVQRRMHALPSPLELDEAVDLWTGRRWALQALIVVGGGENALAKQVEARVSPGGQPLAICLGSAKVHQVQTIAGIVPMHGYQGCLRTFPDPPAGRGKRWPRLCPECRRAQSNALAAAKNELRRHVLGLQPRKPRH